MTSVEVRMGGDAITLSGNRRRERIARGVTPGEGWCLVFNYNMEEIYMFK